MAKTTSTALALILALTAAPLVGQAAARHAVRPGHDLIDGGLLQPAPQHQQGFGHHIIGRRRIGSSVGVRLQRFVHLHEDGLEPSATVCCDGERH